MTHKTLTEMIEEIMNYVCSDCGATYDDIFPECPACGSVYGLKINETSYDRMKRVAIELAKACEDRHDGWLKCVSECRKTCEAISRAKDIIGGGGK